MLINNYFVKPISKNYFVKPISKNYFVKQISKFHFLKKKKISNFLNEINTFKIKTKSFSGVLGVVKRLKKLESIVQLLQNFEKSNQNTYRLQRPLPYISQWVQKGDLLSDCSASFKGELALGKNLFVGYMSWEGLNFEDAVLINEQILSKYVSLHIEKYEIEISDSEKIINKIPKIGSWVGEGEILIGKIVPIVPSILLTHEKLLYDIVGEKKSEIQKKYLKVPSSGRVIRICYTSLKNNQKIQKITIKRFNILSVWRINFVCNKPKLFQNFLCSLKKITIYMAEKRKFKVGDKISGRHGNKGIISQILSKSDMPYLPSGYPLDVLLNPLGVPSRMNVGQIFECLLGFAGQIFQTKFQVLCFDEIYGYEASRSLVYSKLFEACKKTKQKWLLSKESPGKLHLFDGRTGELFNQSILVGSTYLMKLIHIVDEKIHARSTGPYSLITQQPLRGRAKHGGQRFGEMEVWALQGFGISYAIQELLTVKSDDLQGRNQIMHTLLKNTPFRFGTPESLRVVLRELQCLCLQLSK